MAPGAGPDALARHSKTGSAAIRRGRIRQIQVYDLRTGPLTAIENEGDDRQHDHHAAQNKAEKTHFTAVVRHDSTPVSSGENIHPVAVVLLAGFRGYQLRRHGHVIEVKTPFDMIAHQKEGDESDGKGNTAEQQTQNSETILVRHVYSAFVFVVIQPDAGPVG
jgi:hypothetical protein